MFRALLPVLVLLLTACPREPSRAFPLDFVVVDDTSAPRPLAEGEVVELHSGFQGGQHLFVTLRGEDVDEGPAQISLSLLDTETGDRLTRVVDTHHSFAAAADGSLLLENLLLTVDDPGSVVDRAVKLEAIVLSEDDWAEGRASRLINVQWSSETP